MLNIKKTSTSATLPKVKDDTTYFIGINSKIEAIKLIASSYLICDRTTLTQS
jgi:hypothetical protein